MHTRFSLPSLFILWKGVRIAIVEMNSSIKTELTMEKKKNMNECNGIEASKCWKCCFCLTSSAITGFLLWKSESEASFGHEPAMMVTKEVLISLSNAITTGFHIFYTTWCCSLLTHLFMNILYFFTSRSNGSVIGKRNQMGPVFSIFPSNWMCDHHLNKFESSFKP